jgi:hypothetical protein
MMRMIEMPDFTPAAVPAAPVLPPTRTGPAGSTGRPPTRTGPVCQRVRRPGRWPTAPAPVHRGCPPADGSGLSGSDARAARATGSSAPAPGCRTVRPAVRRPDRPAWPAVRRWAATTRATGSTPVRQSARLSATRTGPVCPGPRRLGRPDRGQRLRPPAVRRSQLSADADGFSLSGPTPGPSGASGSVRPVRALFGGVPERRPVPQVLRCRGLLAVPACPAGVVGVVGAASGGC